MRFTEESFGGTAVGVAAMNGYYTQYFGCSAADDDEDGLDESLSFGIASP